MLGDKKIHFLDSQKEQKRQVEMGSSRNFTTSDFEVISLLGRGTFGIVRKVRCKLDGKIYAIKSIPLQKKKFKYKYDAKG